MVCRSSRNNRAQRHVAFQTLVSTHDFPVSGSFSVALAESQGAPSYTMPQPTYDMALGRESLLLAVSLSWHKQNQERNRQALKIHSSIYCLSILSVPMAQRP